MNRKGLIIFVGVLLVAFGVLSFMQSTDKTSRNSRRAALLSAEDATALQSITVSGADSTVTLRRLDDGTFGVDERNGFPADGDKVRKLFTALQQNQRQERVSKSSAGHDRLGLQYDGTGAPAAGTVIVRAIQTDGTAVSEAIIFGQQREASSAAAAGPMPGGPAGGRYVRLETEQSGWLIDEVPPLETDPEAWLSKRLWSVEAEAIASIEIAPAEGDAYRLIREGGSWKIEGGAVNEAVKAASSRAVESLMSDLRFTAMAVRSDVQAPADAQRATVSLTDGSSVEMTTFEETVDGRTIQRLWLDASGDGETAQQIGRHFASKSFEVPKYKLINVFKPRAEVVEIVEPTPAPVAADDAAAGTAAEDGATPMVELVEPTDSGN